MKKKSTSFLPLAARKGSDSGGQGNRYGEPLVGIAEAARLLGVAQGTVRKRIKNEVLPRRKISGRWYFRRSEIFAYIAGHSGHFDG